MKRKIIMTLGAIFGLGLLVSTAWVGVTHATDIRTGDAPTLASGETSDSTLYAAGNSISIKGTVKGDLFCAGANIDITGTIEGDVICAGQNVRIAGHVLGDVRVAGQSIEITSEIAGSVTSMGESLVLSPESKIGRDVTLGGNRAQLEGMIGRDVLGGAATINISGTVGRSVDAEVTALTLDSKALIGSDLNYRSTDRAKIASGAVVAGETRFTERTREQAAAANNSVGMRLWGALYGFIAMFIVGLAALLLAPRAMDAAGTALRKRSVLAFAAGAAILIATPIVTVLLFASVFGIPLALMLFLLWIVGLIASYVVGSYAVGWLVVEKLSWPPRGRRITSLFVGLVLGGLVSLLPIVGGIIIFLLMLCGLGAMMLAVSGRMSDGTKKPAKQKA